MEHYVAVMAGIVVVALKAAWTDATPEQTLLQRASASVPAECGLRRKNCLDDQLKPNTEQTGLPLRRRPRQ